MRVFEGNGRRVAELLGLQGAALDTLEREADGWWRVEVVTAPGAAACCPCCGEASGKVKERAGQRLAHLVVAPMTVTWHKTRWYCQNTACGQGTFVEGGSLAGRGARVTASGREAMGHLVGDWLVAVDRVADAAGVSWHTAHDGFVLVAEQTGIVVADPAAAPSDPAPCDAVEQTDPAGPDSLAMDSLVTDPRDAQAGGEPVLVARSVSGPLPWVGVLGLDEHRRGRPRYHQDPATGRWIEDADRWLTVFTDSGGGHGLLGQVEGRTTRDTATWILSQPDAWRTNIWAVTIDMSTIYRSAARLALPRALVGVDPFHLVQLGNKMVGDVRRRVTRDRLGRRGRDGDPEYSIKKKLVRNAESLSDADRGQLLCALRDLGDAGREITMAWKAKEMLRGVLALSPRRTGHPVSRARVAEQATRLLTYCATVGHTVPEVVTFAETISRWFDEIVNTVTHGLSNATTEGVNRLIKLVYRGAFGLRNVSHQQRRARYTASRSTRPGWLQPVTATDQAA